MFGKTECGLDHATENWKEVYPSKTISIRRFTPAVKTYYATAEVTGECIIMRHETQWKI